ncbi:MAG: alpha-mannosidase, partial [Actinobacteria bacterium]|nr:alpha-mannosidase [Actinomycetota bacterium]
RLSGSAGGGNYVRGDILVTPIVGDNAFDASINHGLRFSHDSEVASPGYYQVFLQDPKITAELTTTTRVGLHRYSFPATDRADIIFDVNGGELTFDGRELSGRNGNNVYFVARFSKPVQKYSLAVDGELRQNVDAVAGDHLKSFFRFKTNGDEPILLKVAISLVSVEGARKNLDAELPGWDFEAVRKKAHDTWKRELSKIEVEGGSQSERRIFYTALYHAFIHPTIYMDVDRQYRSTNGVIYTAKDFDNYTNFSLWDTFRALHPLQTIINPKRTAQFIRTFLERYDHAGRLLIMEFDGAEGDTPPMIGYHSLSVIADAYVKGIRDYDVRKALEAMIKLADDKQRAGKELYLGYGFIPADLKGQSVSRTLEYSYDDWCVTRLAKDFDKASDLNFTQRGEFYKNLFCREVNFMCGRLSNFQWVPDFDPMETINHYTEANAYQYTPFVPQDIEGLIALMGGDAAFEAWLDVCFSTPMDPSKVKVRDVTGLIGQYAHGNEPSHHIAYLYNYVGAAWKTQKMVRKILTTLYTDKPDGIDGNEDCGQMSAWYVMSALGIYAVTPGMDYYVIGSPLFDKVTINLENGKRFEIVANNNGPDRPYIQSATLNGKPYGKSWLRHQDIMRGGALVFEMGDKANRQWGRAKANRPFSPKSRFAYASAPKLRFADIQFLDSMSVAISSDDANARIFYTLDGGEPGETSTHYTKPITIKKSTVLKTKSYIDGLNPSWTITVHFESLDMLDAVALSNPTPGVAYVYREANFPNAKSVSQYPALKSGVMATFNVDSVKDERQFGYNFSGYLKVPETGVYTFAVEANDGAVLTINDCLIVDNDGGHRAQKLFHKIGLVKGWHPIRVDYFQEGLAKSLLVSWQGPGMAAEEIPASVLFHKE